MNVDSEKDFIKKSGKLAIEGAEEILPAIAKMTDLSFGYGITTINTADKHKKGDPELSDTPDFVTTFPEHCMEDTDGAEFVDEAKLLYPIYVDYDMSKEDFDFDKKLISEADEIVITKKEFDISSNPYAEDVLEAINPDVVFVYGVALNVCLKFVVKFLVELGYTVYVVLDAVKELPNIPIDNMLEEWVNYGVNFACVNTLEPDYAADLYNKVCGLLQEEDRTLVRVKNFIKENQ